VDRVAAAVKKLGGFMENKVTASTTHVVCGGPKRTINLLRGIARGCWLVTYEWVRLLLKRTKYNICSFVKISITNTLENHQQFLVIKA